MNKEDIRLNPCPFCGSRNVDMHYLLTNGYYVICRNCEASGGYSLTRTSCIKRWNTRKNNEL